MFETFGQNIRSGIPQWRRPGHGGPPRCRGQPPAARVAAGASATAAHPEWRRPGHHPRYLVPGRADWQSDAGNFLLPRRFQGGYPPRRLPERTAATARSKTTSCVIAGRLGRGSARWKWGGVPRRGASRRGKRRQRRRRGPKPKVPQTAMSPSRTRKRSSDVWKRGDLCNSARKNGPAKDGPGREHLQAARAPRLPRQVYEGKGKKNGLRTTMSDP